MTTLGHRARSAVLWNTGFSLFRDLLQFTVMLVLVRLLAPEVYGQYGLLNSIVGFLYILSFRNFISYTLQVRREEDVFYQGHFTAGALLQLTLFALTNLIAVALRWVDTYAPVAPLLHISSLLFLLGLPSELRFKMLERDLDWKRVRLLHATGLVAAQAMAIGLGLAGGGIYSLVIPPLLISLPFIYDLFVVQRWRPNWSWSQEQYAPAWNFGLARMASGGISYGRQLMESSLLVHFVGYTTFGFYGRATGLAQMFCYKFAFLLMQAIYPVLTRIEPQTKEYSRAGGLVLRSVAWIAIPVSTIFIVLADPIIRIVYGEKWLDVISLLPWAMAAGAAGAIVHASYMLLLANQQQKLCLILDTWLFAATAASLFWLAPKGVKPYLISLAVIQGITVVVVLYFAYFNRAIALRGIINAIVLPLFATACTFVVCEFVWKGSVLRATSFWAALYAIGFGLMYVGLLRLFFSAQLGELVNYFPGGHRLMRLLMLRA